MDREASELSATAMSRRRRPSKLPSGQPGRDHNAFSGNQQPTPQRCAEHRQSSSLETRVGDELRYDVQTAMQQPIAHGMAHGTPIGGRLMEREGSHSNCVEAFADDSQGGQRSCGRRDIGAQHLAAKIQAQPKRQSQAPFIRQTGDTVPADFCPTPDQSIEIDQSFEFRKPTSQQAGRDVQDMAIGVRTRKAIDSDDFSSIEQKIVRVEPIRFVGAHETPMQFHARAANAFEDEVEVIATVNLEQRCGDRILVSEGQQQPMSRVTLIRAHQQIEITEGSDSGARVDATRQCGSLENHGSDAVCGERGAKALGLHPTQRLMARLADEMPIEFFSHRGGRTRRFAHQGQKPERVGVGSTLEQGRPRIGRHREIRVWFAPDQGLQSGSNEHELALRKGRAL